MNFPRYQRGMGAVGWLFVIVLFGGVLSLGTKLFPYYLDFTTMSSVLDSMAEIDGLASRRISDIKSMVDRRFSLNNIRDFPIDENIEFKRTNSGVEINLTYEARVPLFYNLDLVAYFEKQVDLRN